MPAKTGIKSHKNARQKAAVRRELQAIRREAEFQTELGKKMLLALMGFWFISMVGGLGVGIVVSIISPSARWARFSTFSVGFGGLFSFCLSWGSALGLEHIGKSERIAGLGFACGALLGGALGILLAAYIAFRGARSK